MKKILVAAVMTTMTLFMGYVIGCTPKGIPVATTIAPTPTFTRTPTPMGPTPTPGTATFPTLYTDGSLAGLGGIKTDLFSGNSPSGNPTTNAIDTTANGEGGDWYGYMFSWSSSQVSAMSGYSGAVIDGNATDFSAYTTCKFWAKANQSMSVGFNAAEPSGDTANIAESLTTSWAQFTLNIASGSRSDGQAGTITAVQNYFVVVITAAPGSTPLNVSIDNITFQ